MGISPTTLKNQFIESMIKGGATLQACTMWFALMTSAATNEDQLEYVWRLTDLGKHIEAHPVNIITTCLSQGKFTKVDDEMMKCVFNMVSDDTDSQCDKDDFWKDADGEVEIISKKRGLECDDDDSSDSASYEEEEACEHDVVGECVECSPPESPKFYPQTSVKVSGLARSNALVERKRKLVPRCVDDEADEIGVSA